MRLLGSPGGVFNYTALGLLHVDDDWGIGHRNGLRAAAAAAREAPEPFSLRIESAQIEDGRYNATLDAAMGALRAARLRVVVAAIFRPERDLVRSKVAQCRRR